MVSTRKASRLRDDWMTVPAAAAAIRETRLSVLSRIVRGELVAKQMAGRTLIRRDSVDALIATRAEKADAVA